MSDPIFVAQLYAKNILTSYAMESIKARLTRAEKAEFFLENCIANAFNDDGSNPRFYLLLEIMRNSDDMVLVSVAEEIKSKLN